MSVSVQVELSQEIYQRLQAEAQRRHKEPHELVEEMLERGLADPPVASQASGKRVDLPLIPSSRKDKINPTNRDLDDLVFG